jgi:hypothetical protein
MGAYFNPKSCPLPRVCSDWQFCFSHSIANLPLYQCVKLGALNPRINEIMSDKFWFIPLLQVQTPRFFIPVIFWISKLVAIFLGHQGPSWTAIYMSPLTHIKINLESCSKLKSWSKESETKMEFHQRICFIDQAFVNHLHYGCRKDSNKKSAVLPVHPIVQQPQRSKWLLAQMNSID